VVASELDAALVEGVGDHVVVVGRWLERSEQVSLELGQCAHASELEVAHPQIAERESDLAPRRVEGCNGTFSQGVSQVRVGFLRATVSHSLDTSRTSDGVSRRHNRPPGPSLSKATFRVLLLRPDSVAVLNIAVQNGVMVTGL